MKIRTKIVLIVLPLIVTPLLFTGFTASYSARNGITQVATNFLRFKSEELVNYARSQWNLLEVNDLVDRPEFVDATKAAIESFAYQLIRSATEIIFAVNADGQIEMGTRDVAISESEKAHIVDLLGGEKTGWQSIELAGREYIAHIAGFDNIGWTFFITEERDTFYHAINQIFQQTALILVIALAVSLGMLFILSMYLTRPLAGVVAAMKDIITSNDLSKRVEVLYKDETGDLGHTFNLMTGELEKAYKQIKGYALDAAIARTNEQKIRNLFQKYVPNDIIEEVFANPESALVGQDRILALLFSDVRGFTTISESMFPQEVVESLNEYFGRMVEIVINSGGIADKYMGDGLMAFFGAPKRKGDEALRAVIAGLDMIDELTSFNEWLRKRNRKPWKIGIGLNYGNVTVGNIGYEKKMDYTVIGDMVNTASRIEGLTKVYREPIIISESVTVSQSVRDAIPYRMIDRVVVKGKTSHSGIYVPKRDLTERENRGWEIWSEGLELYYSRQFERASKAFSSVMEYLPEDRYGAEFIKRCADCLREPPPESWTGAVVMAEK